MKRMTNSFVSADGILTLTYTDSTIGYNLEERVFDLNKLRENEVEWNCLEETLRAEDFTAESINNIKKLFDILLFDGAEQDL